MLRLLAVLVIFLMIQVPGLSLDINERQDIIVTHLHNRSVITINRGREDGINRWEHIKIYDKQGFVGRGVCLRSLMDKSYWLAYHVTDSKKLLVNKHLYYKKIDVRYMPRIVFERAKDINVDRAMILELARFEPLARDDSKDPFYTDPPLGEETMGLYRDKHTVVPTLDMTK